MEIQELNEAKIPLVKINKKLNRFKGKVIFKEKLDRANKLLERAVLPKLAKD
ncbi:MAG: hypothetical protein K9H64_09495 [Bacteroidales bacterium]|nr:hypothetical protein [Bacteroidales bacterium]MCF8456099.1 hypothetical protein [Bacteroidales bacterium]